MELQPKYIANVIDIEKTTLTPIVFSMSGGMGPAAMVFYKRIVENIANKSLQRYCDNVLFIRCRLRFDLLFKTCLISLRGFMGKKAAVAASLANVLDANLIK